MFFKEIILDGILGPKHYAIRIGFQERGSLHVHWLLWIFNAPNIRNETDSIAFIGGTFCISQDLPSSCTF